MSYRRYGRRRSYRRRSYRSHNYHHNYHHNHYNSSQPSRYFKAFGRPREFVDRDDRDNAVAAFSASHPTPFLSSLLRTIQAVGLGGGGGGGRSSDLRGKFGSVSSTADHIKSTAGTPLKRKRTSPGAKFAKGLGGLAKMTPMGAAASMVVPM